jgi:hypothetical protein
VGKPRSLTIFPPTKGPAQHRPLQIDLAAYLGLSVVQGIKQITPGSSTVLRQRGLAISATRNRSVAMFERARAADLQSTSIS